MPINEFMGVMWRVFFIVNFVQLLKLPEHNFLFELAAHVRLPVVRSYGVDSILFGIIFILIELVSDFLQLKLILFLDVK
jgi:hypothetical protein